jgi:hypothetical protein
MNKISKILFAIILSVSFVNFAQAGELTVTGSAEATYTITSSDSSTAKNNTNKALGLSNELDFNAKGEFGNGFTWTYQVQLDPADNLTLANTTPNDDTSLVIGTPYGNIGIFQTEGDLNTHLAYSAAAYAPGHDIGNSGGYQGGTGMNSYNNIAYHSPAGLLPFGTTFKAAYSNGDNIQSNDAANAGTTEGKGTVESYQITTKPIDGLTVGASYLEINDSGSTTAPDYKTGGGYAKYSMGQFTVGAGRHYVEINQRTTGTSTDATTTKAITPSTTYYNSTTGAFSSTSNTYTAGLKYFENTAYSVGFAVNEELSLSYDKLTSTAHIAVQSDKNVRSTADRDLTVATLQAAYNIGGAVVSVSQKSIENKDYADGVDLKEYMFGIKMAF